MRENKRTCKTGSSKRGACGNRLRVSCIALTRKPDLDNANVGNICMKSVRTAVYPLVCRSLFYLTDSTDAILC